ncbi:Vacuolar protein sorting 26 [Entamoeba marina]
MSFLFYSSHTILDDWLAPLSENINVPTDQLKYFASLLISIPICIGYRYLPNYVNLKHFIYGVTGFILTYLVFGLEVFSTFFTAIPSYIVMKYTKTQRASNICFLYIFGYLLYRHFYLYFDQYLEWSLDFTTTHMILTLKLTAFCFSVSNGKKKHLTPYLEDHKITKYPSILEFFGFVFFFPGLFSGPALEYNDYISFINMSRFKDNNYQIVDIPKLRFCMNFFGGVAFYMCQIALGFINLPHPQYYIEEHPESCGLMFKLMTIWWTLTSFRIKYYGTWKLTESLSDLSGCGFSGFVDGKPTFKLYENIHIIDFETSRSMKINFDVWNMYVQKWLKNYVYTTVNLTSLAPWKTYVTLFVSAFWHGVYPGYYLTFFGLIIHKNASDQIYKKIDPYMIERFGKDSIIFQIYDIILRIYNHWSLNYAVYPFIRFEFLPSLIVFKRTYFLGHIIPFIIYQLILHCVKYPSKSTDPSNPKQSTLKKIKNILFFKFSFNPFLLILYF